MDDSDGIKRPTGKKTFPRRLERDEQGEIGRGRKNSPCLMIKERLSVVNLEEIRGEIRKKGVEASTQSNKIVYYQSQSSECVQEGSRRKKNCPVAQL